MVPQYRPCLLLWCLTTGNASGVVPHHQPCLLVCCLTIGHAFWRGASLSTMPIGVLPHYRTCLLVWFLVINHACWCGSSLWTMPVGVVPHYMSCLLVYSHCNQHFTCRVQMEEGVLTSLVLPVQRCHYIRHV